MPRLHRAVSLVFATWIFATTIPVSAHQTGKSVFIAHVKPTQVDTLLTLPLLDVVTHLELAETGPLSDSDREKISSYFSKTVRVAVDDKTCPTSEIRLGPATRGQDIWFLKAFECSQTEHVQFDVSALTESEGGYMHVAKIEKEKEIVSTVFSVGQTTWTLGERTSVERPNQHPFVRFFILGFEHVLIGIDHLLFLIGLILIAVRMRDLIALTTTFTVAHATTIVVSALDIASIQPSIIEPLIALTIAAIGLETFRYNRTTNRAFPTQAVVVVFLLGLIHGFGFSYALRDAGLPTGQEVVTLLGFNLGVEAAQVLFVAVGFGLMGFATRSMSSETAQTVKKGAGLTVAGIGLVWFLARLLG